MVFKTNFKKILFFSFLCFVYVIFYHPLAFLKFNVVNSLVKDLGFKLNHIKVTGNNSVEKEAIINKLVFHNCDNLFCIDLNKSKEEIEKNNWIRSAKIKYSLPSKLSIIIKEEKPIFLLKVKNKFSLLNEEGKKYSILI